MKPKYVIPPPRLAPKAPYKEPMPVDYSCPPSAAMPLMPQQLMRFVGPNPVQETDFFSYAGNDLPCPINKVCDWVACSFFLPTIEKYRIKDLVKYPNLQSKTHLAYISVDQQSGPAEIKQSKHVSVWLHDGFYPENSISEMVKIEDYVSI